MNTTRTLSIVAAFAASLTLLQTVSAEQPRLGKRGKPPQVALDACANAAEGNACSFEGRRGDTLSGSCAIARSGDLACLPEGHRPRGERGEDQNQDSQSL